MIIFFERWTGHGEKSDRNTLKGRCGKMSINPLAVDLMWLMASLGVLLSRAGVSGRTLMLGFCFWRRRIGEFLRCSGFSALVWERLHKDRLRLSVVALFLDCGAALPELLYWFEVSCWTLHLHFLVSKIFCLTQDTTNPYFTSNTGQTLQSQKPVVTIC